MQLVSFQNVTKKFSQEDILSGVSFTISSGGKLGLIGPNGSGKTTILKILTGEEQPDDGAVALSKGVNIGYVPQQVTFEKGMTVSEYLLAEYLKIEDLLKERERELSDARSEEERDEAARRYQTVFDRHERMGGYTYPSRAEGMLDALGLPEKWERNVQSLSGGEKNVLALTRALLAEPDLLLLDEPANHLDFEGVAWLESFLVKFKGTVIIVSHNRYLLDRVVQGVYHLEQGGVTYYDGGYTSYREARLRDLLAQQADYKANQRRLERLEKNLRRMEDQARNRADPKLGKRVKARRTQLEREKAQAVPKPRIEEEGGMKLRLQGKRSQADIALQVKNYNKVFGEKRLFEDADLEIYCGERVALVGGNGSGKSTLLKDIVKHGSWEKTEIRIGPSLTVGFCSQEQEILSPTNTVLQEMYAEAEMKREEALSILARFNFRGDDVDKKVKSLSGGERNRLQLARVLVSNPNFLILDEPTNHLDIPMREAVEEALEDFKGTLLVVSHDRYFLDKVVERVVEVREKSLFSFGGNFSDFWMIHEKMKNTSSDGRIQSRGKSKKDSRKKNRSKNSNWIRDLEKKITQTEEKRNTLDAAMLKAYEKGEVEEGNRLAEELKTIDGEIEQLYERLMELEE